MGHLLLWKKILSVKEFSVQMYLDMRLYPGSQNNIFLQSSSTDDKLKSAELRCTEFCQFGEKNSGDETIHTYCCSYDDFCNSIDLPIVMT